MNRVVGGVGCWSCSRRRRRWRKSISWASGPAATTRISPIVFRVRSRATSAACRINEAARLFGDSWDVARHSVLEHQCAPYTLPYMFFGPNQFRIWQEHNQDTQELIAIRMHLGTYQQERTIWMDGRPHPPEYAPHTFMGFSTGVWNGDTLTITTTHIKAGYFRRTGFRRAIASRWSSTGCGTATCSRRSPSRPIRSI